MARLPYIELYSAGAPSWCMYSLHFNPFVARPRGETTRPGQTFQAR